MPIAVPLYRPSALVLCAALECLLISHWAGAVESPRWFADRADAALQARKQGKLLVVVQLSGDFARNAADANELQIYRSIATADPRIAAEFRNRYVVAWQHVGEADSLRKLAAAPLRSKVTAERRADFAITYVCLPDLRVLHFIPGFVTSDELLGELAWAEGCYDKVGAALAGAEELTARQAHQATTAKSDLVLFHKQFPSRWSGDALAQGRSTVDLPTAVVAARVSVAQSLVLRLGGSWPRQDVPAILSTLAAHGALGREIAHPVLAEFPLVSLSDLERPAFEACSGQRFWTASRRRAKLVQWWKESLASKRPMLLVVADDPYATAADKAGMFEWPPENTAALPRLPLFACELVSIDEMAALATDVSLPALSYRAGQSPRYLVFSAGGKPAAQLSKSTSLTRLTQALEAAAGSGALVTAASKREGESDADDD